MHLLSGVVGFPAYALDLPRPATHIEAQATDQKKLYG